MKTIKILNYLALIFLFSACSTVQPTVSNKNEKTVVKKETRTIKSFSNDFKVKLLSVEGYKNNQTVKIEFLISHKLVHQQVCFYFGKGNAKMYDFEGNEYLAKNASIGTVNKNLGSFSGLGYLSNKVPTNVPVKATIVFKQILPDKNKISFATIKVGCKANDSEINKYKFGTLELNNVEIDWK